jgi:beta-glucosidase
LCGGSPIALGELEEMVEAVVFVWYPGQAGGLALADVLFGDVSPSGKLPITFPKSTRQLPAFDDYSMDARTYRYSSVEPLFPFGFGLSYTRFAYENLKLTTGQIKAGQSLSFSVTLKNIGTMDAEDVVQAYLSDLEASAPVPRHRLVGFRRCKVRVGKSKVVKFTLPPEMLTFVDETGEQKLEPGQFRLTVGSCSPGKRGAALGAPEPLSRIFTVE